MANEQAGRIAKKHYPGASTPRAQAIYADNVEADLEQFFEDRNQAALSRANAENQASLTSQYLEEKEALEAKGILKRGKTHDGYFALQSKYKKYGWNGLGK